MPEETPLSALAVDDFQRARRRAALQGIVARLSGRSADLLSFDDVRRKLRLESTGVRRLQDIPLDAVVGSVARYNDFNRSFLPRNASDEQRWARVKNAMLSERGVPPIEAYKIDSSYFILDGNHRVSVAREMGEKTIHGYVTEVQTRVPLAPQDTPTDVIRKAEYAEFLSKTSLDKLRPDADLSVTVPGQYRVLLEHVDVQRYYLSAAEQRPVAYQEAVEHWYDDVYLPIVQVIRDQGLLAEFPGRTETDLYLWVAQHRTELREALGWELSVEHVAEDLAARHSPLPGRVMARVGDQLLRAVTPAVMEEGPRTGAWRQHAEVHADRRLFEHVLVAISGEASEWPALDQALIIAKRENSTLLGLHVVPLNPNEAARSAQQSLEQEFQRRCAIGGCAGQLAADAGPVAETISHRARWADLVVVHVAHPPAAQALSRVRSGLRTLIQRCPRPVLCVPHVTPLERALLAYDGSPKSEEALFVATYLAGRWNIPLVVATALETGRTTANTQARARRYLEEHGVEAAYVEAQGDVCDVLTRTAEEHRSDLIIAGGYGFTPLLEVVLGSAVDELLRARRWPILICR